MGKTIKKIVAIGGGGFTHESDDTLDKFYKAKYKKKKSNIYNG